MNIKFLIIDAHPVYVSRLVGFLGSMSFKSVDIAPKGVFALNIFLEKQPDVVILSATLPDADSLEVAKLIKSKSKSTPIIVQTGLLTTEVQKEAFEAAGVEFVIPRLEKDWSSLENAVLRCVEQLASHK